MPLPPNPAWLEEFRTRMGRFGNDGNGAGIPVSIKLRLNSGCFCHNCAPEAHRLLDDYRRQHPPEADGMRIVEHESGPEILTYLPLATASLALTAGVINLIVAIVKARSEGMKHGDRHGPPFELILRRFDEDSRYSEEHILRVPPESEIDAEELAKELMKYSIKRAATSQRVPAAKSKKAPGKTKSSKPCA